MVQLAQLDLQDLVVVLQVQPDHKEFKVLKEYKDLQGLLVQPDHKEFKVFKEYRDLRDLLVQLDHKEFKALKEYKDLQEILVKQALQGKHLLYLSAL
jgi:hypothetical protein